MDFLWTVNYEEKQDTGLISTFHFDTAWVSSISLLFFTAWIFLSLNNKLYN